MSGKSTIELLEPVLRQAIDGLLRKGKTLDQILDHLAELGAEDAVSRSALGRYAKRTKKNWERFQEAQKVAGVWIKKLDEDPHGDVGKLVAEMLKTVSFVTIDQMLENDKDEDGNDQAPATPQEIMFLAKAIKDLETAGATSLKRELAVREEIERQAKKVATQTEKTLKEQGLSDDTVQLIKSNILGISNKRGQVK